MNIFRNNSWLLIIIAFFIFARFFGLGQLYHQDEYRWATIVNPEFKEGISPHPPVMEFVLSAVGGLFGYENLRLAPLVFSILNLVLLYLISLHLTGNKKTALTAAGLLTVSIYSFIASLQIDMDGAVLPFFVLSSYYFYLRLRASGDKKFILLFSAAIIGGFMTKISFVLFAVALATEYLWTLYQEDKFRDKIKRIIFWFGLAIAIVSGIYAIYGYNHPRLVEYVEGFKAFNFGSRAYFELFMRLFKFFIWLSPMLLLPLVYGIFKKEIFSRYRVWFIYTLFNFVFYLVIFDFARLPIERYFMFIILPAILISAEFITSQLSKLNRKYLVLSLVGFALLVIVGFLVNYEVVPLNPKEAYIEKVRDLDFNFLIPLTGGSGPIGFYASAQFILWTWFACAVGLFMNRRRWAIYLFLIFGLGYNVFLSSEFLFGSLYGSVNKITKQSVDYVLNNDDIDEVITYYDAGVYYLRMNEKYNGRFYTAPSRDYAPKLTIYRGHYLIVDFPAIDKKSKYWELISRCAIDIKFTDKYVDSYIFDCSRVPVASLDKST